MIAHVILFKPRPGLAAAERGAVLQALTNASRDIPGIRSFRVGRRVRHGLPGYEQMMPEDFEFFVIIEVDNLEALKRVPDTSLTRRVRRALHTVVGRGAGLRLRGRRCRRGDGAGGGKLNPTLDHEPPRPIASGAAHGQIRGRGRRPELGQRSVLPADEHQHQQIRWRRTILRRDTAQDDDASVRARGFGARARIAVASRSGQSLRMLFSR